MTWKIGYTGKAKKYLDSLEAAGRDRIKEALQKMLEWLCGLREDMPDLKKLKGDWKGYYRLRVGKERLILNIKWERQEVVVEYIEKRGDIY